MNVAVGVIPCSLELLNWRAHIALEMWKLVLPKHVTRLDERIWQHFSMVQARQRGFEICNSDYLRGVSASRG